MAGMARRGTRGAHSARHRAGRAQLDVPKRYDSGPAGVGRLGPVEGTEARPDNLGEPRQGERPRRMRGPGELRPDAEADGQMRHESFPAPPAAAPGVPAATPQDGSRAET